MKRKMSVGLVMALIALMIAVGALAAALLGGKDFVDQVLAPKAIENQEEKWTKDEIAEILRIADENGIALSEDLRERLERDDAGYYKEELMRAFAKTELGFYPSTWSVEDQAWYNALLIECGLLEIQTNAVPEGDELSQAEIAEIAEQYLKAQYGASPEDLRDAAKYTRHMSFNETKHSEYHTSRDWYLDYEAMDLTLPGYLLEMSPDGEVRSGMVIGAAGDVTDPNGLLNLYRDTHGAHQEWDQALWREFHEKLTRLCETKAPESDSLKMILSTEYLDVDENALPREDAIETAKAAIMAAFPDAELNNYDSTVYIAAKPNPIWKVWLGVDGARGLLCEVDAVTGEALSAITLEAGDPWSRPFVTETVFATFAANRPTLAPQPTRRPDGRRWIWYSDLMPVECWDALAAVNYNTETADALWTGWVREYGQDMLFWPLEAKAINYYTHDIIDADQVILPGVPLEGDISQEEAVEIARKAFREGWDALNESIRTSWSEKMEPSAFADSLQPSVNFWYNKPERGDRQYEIRMIDVTNHYGVTVGVVQVDAQTGEVLHVQADAGNG